MTRFNFYALIGLLIFFNGLERGFTEESTSLSLAGEWQVQLGSRASDGGWKESLPSSIIQLPGSIQAQGLGNEVSSETKWIGGIQDRTWWNSPLYEKFRKKGQVKIPFWFQPDKHYIGTVGYRREFTIPKDWDGRRIFLKLERVHTTATIWLDGKEVGKENSLSTPHRFDLGYVAPGRHRLVMFIDNQMIENIGENSHSVSDHMQTAWNGVVGDIQLEAFPSIWIEDLQIYPKVDDKSIKVTWALGGNIHKGSMALKVLTPEGKSIQNEFDLLKGEAVVSLGDNIQTWDEFRPNLYKLDAKISTSGGHSHTVTSSFGMVDYRVEGKHFYVNGRKTIFRGTLDCAMFPMTGYPSTDIGYWKNVYKVIKAHGLNHVRFHSWCPPKAAFIAADEIGIYLLAEHAWTNPEKAGAYLMREAERVIKAYGNHPSFAMHAYGNEPTQSHEWMDNFAKHFQQIDPRRYYTGAIGWPRLKNNQFHSLMAGLRVYSWGAGLKSHLNAETPNTMSDFRATTKSDSKPMLAHETGQWCVYPDFTEISKYTGFLKAKNFEIFQEFLTNHHLADQAHDFLMASGRLQILCYKYEIEKLLRTPDIGGYQLLGLNDFPGQGTALVGCVNPLWETKPYTSPKEVAQFSGPSVLLARLPKFIFKNNETLLATLEMTHSGERPLRKALTTWRIVSSEGHVYTAGELDLLDIPLGQSMLGKLEVPLQGIPTPSQVKLEVSIDSEAISNSWDLWIYPSISPKSSSDKVVITHNSVEAMDKANSGSHVLLLPTPVSIVKPYGPKVAYGFSTIFWNTAWTKRQPPTTMGILCNPKHPVFSAFPTDYHSNYQWWYPSKLVVHPISLEGQVPEMRPLVQVIDDWFTARRLGLIVEASYGQGKIIICAIDFDRAKPDDIVSQQLRSSIITYMESPEFKPKFSITEEQFLKMINPQAVENDLKANIIVSSHSSDTSASDLYDKDSTTFWHSDRSKSVQYPHEIKFELEKTIAVTGIWMLPQQNENRASWVKNIEIQTSQDGNSWVISANGTLHNNPEDWSEFKFPASTAKFIKITALSPQKMGDPTASFSEIEILTKE